MGFYSHVIFPRLCDWVLRDPRVAQRRQELLAHARGRILEIGIGTGLNLQHYPDHVRRITAIDPNAGMRRLARRRMERSGMVVDMNLGCAESLPFGDAAFDGVVSTFTLCSVDDVEAALDEIYRVLRPGGRFLCLEFSAIDVPLLDRLYDAYSFNAIPALGGLVAGDSAPYRYLVESIRRFPDQEKFTHLIENAGLERVRYRNLSGGIAAIHSAWRL